MPELYLITVETIERERQKERAERERIANEDFEFYAKVLEDWK